MKKGIATGSSRKEVPGHQPHDTPEGRALARARRAPLREEDRNGLPYGRAAGVNRARGADKIKESFAGLRSTYLNKTSTLT